MNAATAGLDSACRAAVVGGTDPGGRVRIVVGIEGDNSQACLASGLAEIPDSDVGVGGDCNRNDDGSHLPSTGNCANPSGSNANASSTHEGFLFMR